MPDGWKYDIFMTRSIEWYQIRVEGVFTSTYCTVYNNYEINSKQNGI